MSDNGLRDKILGALGDAAPAASTPAESPASPAIDYDKLAGLVADKMKAAPRSAADIVADARRAQPRIDPGPVIGAPPWERPSNPFSWTEEDVRRLQSVKGTRAANKIIRQKAEEFARSVRFNLTNGRR